MEAMKVLCCLQNTIYYYNIYHSTVNDQLNKVTFVLSV